MRRHRHRQLLDLVGNPQTGARGVVILDTPSPTAYCLPGIRSRIVVSAGALQLLSSDESAAVIAHERAHSRAHHDLVLLPFQALTILFPRSRAVSTTEHRVACLLEMAADDQALKSTGHRVLAGALQRMAAANQACSINDVTSDANLRIARALKGHCGSRSIACCAGIAVVATASIPIFLLGIPGIR
jgi:Zn-dependent protease with chaperone function